MSSALICGKCSSSFERRHGGPSPRFCYECKPSKLHPRYFCRRCSCIVEKGRWVCDPCKVAARASADLRKAVARRGGKVEPNYRRRANGSPRIRTDRSAEYERARRSRAEASGISLEQRAVMRAELAAAREAAKADRAEARARRVAERIRLKPWSDPALSRTERFVLRYRLDPEFAIKQRMRAAFRRRRQGHKIGDALRLAVVREGSSPSVERFLGYTAHDLRRHLERQFQPGMSWALFCDGRIHIDHILPLSSFRVSDPDELRSAWALPNLRPLWAEANIAKGSRVVTLL